MNKILLIAAIAGGIAFSSCQKDNTVQTAATGMDDLVVPAGFNWATARDVSFDVSVSDSRFGEAIHVISIYAGDPSNGGTILSKGSATLLSSYKTSVYLPSVLNEVYVVKTAPDGTKVSQKVAVTGTSVSLSAGSQGLNSTVSVSAAKGLAVVSADPVPVCDCEVAEQVTSDKSSINSSDANKTFCVTKDNVKLTFNTNGNKVIFKICAKNVTITGKWDSQSEIIVTESGSVNFSGQMDSNTAFKNYGSVTVTTSINSSVNVVNNGKFKVTSGLTINNGGSFINNAGADFRVQGTFQLNVKLINYGHINVEQDFHINGSGDNENYCSMYVKDNFSTDKKLKNYGYVNVGYVIDENNPSLQVNGIGNIKLNGSGIIDLYDKALFSTKTITDPVDGFINGVAGTSLFIISNSNNNLKSRSNKFTGNIIVLNLGNTKIDDQLFVLPAKQVFSEADANISIPKSDCNPGFGSAPDRDNDGIIDSEDDFPDDPTRAFKKYSVNYHAGGATVLFEDNWPQKGDYDMNDIVISYRYLVTLNAQNKVVQVDAAYTLYATGATLDNGFGVEFPFKVSDLKADEGVSGATPEGSGSDKAVIVVFNNAHQHLTEWNTTPGKTSATKDFNVVLKFNAGSVADFGAGPYNPFIFNSTGTDGKRNEVHLPGHQPTKSAGNVLGNGVNSGTEYYVTTGNLPWAIQVPLVPFAYPVERASIADAYPGILSWATNGGAVNGRWYEGPNNQYIFK